MSLFNSCENCEKLGTHACGTKDPPRFICASCAMNLINSWSNEPIKPAVEGLTPSEVSSLRDAYENYRNSSLRQAIQMRNSQIEHYLQEIRRAEEECSSILEIILNGPITRSLQEVLSYQALPLFSDSSLVRSLLDLKHAPDFSSPKIFDLLNTINFSLLSSFPSFFSSPVSSSSIPDPSAPSVQASSQQSSVQMVDPTNYQWELLQQTKAHNEDIFSIAVSECEKYLASGSRDGTIKIYELQTFGLLHTLEGHTYYVRAVAFLGNKIVSGSADMTIKIWEEGRCVNTLYPHLSWVTSVSVSSCKRLIVSGSKDKTIVVFRLEDNKTLHTLTHEHRVRSVAFSHNDKEIVSGSGAYNSRGLISIWKTETGELLKTLCTHAFAVTCVKFSGNFIASSSRDKTVKIWDRDKNQLLHTFTDHTLGVGSVDVKDNLVASLGADDRIILRDIRSGTVIQTLQAHGKHLDIPETSSAKYDSDSDSGSDCDSYSHTYSMGLKLLEGAKFIVSGGGDGNLKVWKRVN